MPDLFKLFQSCDHTRQPLQRRSASGQEFKFGLPGIGTILSVGGPQVGGYTYYCPACKSNLPPGQNARWEALYSQSHQAAISRSRPQSVSTKSRPPTRHKREAIGVKLRYDIMTRDNNRCRKCGATGEQVRLHVDHIKPVAHGGTNEPSNLQTLCEKCNLGKGARQG